MKIHPAQCRATGWMLWCLTVALALGLAGCRSETDLSEISESELVDDFGDEEGGLSELQGNIVIDGSSTVFPISEAIASAFREKYPQVSPTVGTSGTGGGFKRFTRGEIDISNASRPIKWEEFQQARRNQVRFIELPVAYDGLSIVVNPANDWVDQLTVDQLKKIFLEQGAAQTWQDVNPEWPATPIKIYAPGTDSGTFDYFREVVAGDEGAMRSDMSTSEDDNVLITGVAGEENAIGFFGAAYYFNNQEKLRAVPIVNPEGQAVLPTPENVESGVYAPFSRPLFIYVAENSLRRPEVKKFVEFYLDNAVQTAKQVDYVPLPSELYERARKHAENRLSGTHFLEEGGQERRGPLAEVYTEENLLPVVP